MNRMVVLLWAMCTGSGVYSSTVLWYTLELCCHLAIKAPRVPALASVHFITPADYSLCQLIEPITGSCEASRGGQLRRK